MTQQRKTTLINSTTRFWESYFHTPSEFAIENLAYALRAGHLTAGRDYRVERRICAGHDFLYCVHGKGTVIIGGARYSVDAGQLAWIDGHYPHAHQADPSNPWELLWVRVDGPSLAKIGLRLGVTRNPVFTVPAIVEGEFRKILELLREPSATSEVRIHAEIALLFAGLFESRHCDDNGNSKAEDSLLPVMDKMRVYYYRNWSSAELAKLAGMSVPHFFRCFHRSTGLSPLKWLRTHRINEAKRRLVETRDSVKEIAEQVGYSDQFYFSRDFHKVSGTSPSEFRRREAGLDTHKIT